MNNILANPIRTKADWQRMRDMALNEPDKFYGQMAKNTLYWFDDEKNCWVKYNESKASWIGFNATSGMPIDSDSIESNYTPWQKVLDDHLAPFYHWFVGAKTNACFNEVDAHVLSGFGEEIAFHFEGDRWDPSLNDGKGGPVNASSITRKTLLWEVVKRALVLTDLGLKKGDRIVLNMPNILEQIYYIEAAKRLGIIYSCVFGGFSAKTLSDRIQDLGAKVIITTDGAYRNAQVTGFKENYIDKALADYIAVTWGLETLAIILKNSKVLDNKSKDFILDTAKNIVAGEITVERSEIMQGVGNALDKLQNLGVSDKAHLRTLIASALVDAPNRVLKVIVVQHTKIPDLAWNSNLDVWSHDLVEMSLQKFMTKAKDIGVIVKNETQILKLELSDFNRLIYNICSPIPVAADYPLFIIYTSGSTGKPKGVVHTHGGYLVGIAYTMQISFDIPINPDLNKGQVIFVVADPGWITGQSYMISAALVTRTTSLLLEGSPLFPNSGRFASVIERYKVNVFKAGSTFLKAVASDSANIVDVKRYDLTSLKVATFCAEPTSPAIQEFAMQLLTPDYINSYWATEHGGIILTHFYGNTDFKLLPNAHTFPLPWIFADVWVPERMYDKNGKASYEYHIGSLEEKGEIVITKPYPYMARTIWGDADNVNKENWQGDVERFKNVYFSNWLEKDTNGKTKVLAYTQGDFASKHSDGGFTLHGRSDDVINTSGHRIGTEEIEGAILKDKQTNPDSIVGNAIVIGAPDIDKGTVPVAFILTKDGQRLSIDDEQRLINLVRQEKGAVAVPAGFITLSQFPETRSGKYMRRFLQRMLEDQPLGDTSTLRNPESLKEAERGIKKWQTQVKLSQEHDLLQVHATLRVETHEITPKNMLAIVTIARPPVNSLDERSMDELNTVLEHLQDREEIKAIIITGAGTKAFVSGADVRQLLEEMHTKQDVLPLSNHAAKIMCMIERMQKPVIAAINGVALGGGDELQMSCHYRIAEDTAEFGQPEINLNLIPGYGGTQRLPRILNGDFITRIIRSAIIILSGRQINAEEALEIGLIHEIAREHDALTRSVELVREYIMHPNSALDVAHKLRLQQISKWDESQNFPTEEFNSNVEIIALKKQAEFSGRSAVDDVAIDAIKFGLENGFTAGLEHEAELFATLVVDPHSGKQGIRAFFDKKSAPLPVKVQEHLEFARNHEQELLEMGELIKMGSPFYPGVSEIPKYQYGFLIEKDPASGLPKHGDPIVAECKRIIPIETPKSNEALIYMLSSEINFNDIWAITGVPVSPFDSHDQDWHVTGSGGLGLIVELGEELRHEGRVKVGSLVAIFSGQSQLLDPVAGLDPMFADQHIQGYEIPNGSHQQFMIAQGPQIHNKLPDLTLEAAGCYMLNLGTIYRALFTTLQIEANKTIFVEGASTGTGFEAVKVAAKNGLQVIGMVSSEERAKRVLQNGAIGIINRSDLNLKSIYTKVPENKSDWQTWQSQGQVLLETFKQQTGGKLADYVISHAGEISFPRSFQLLAENGVLTFYGASSGYNFTFIGKHGVVAPEIMLHRAQIHAGQSVLMFYGLDDNNPADPVGLEIIEACKEMQSKIAICTQTDAQANFVKSMGYGDAVKGVFSLAALKRKEGDLFVIPESMPQLPDSKTETSAFKEAVRWYQEYVFKPFAQQVGGIFKGTDNPKGQPDFVFERAHQDTLCLSTMLIKPYTGKVIYCEDLANRRYSFYAPQVWMRQRRIYMPTANIWGTHLSNSYEIQALNELINAGSLNVDEPLVVSEAELARAHQDMWENNHKASNYLFDHALPSLGLKSKDDLYHAWSLLNNTNK